MKQSITDSLSNSYTYNDYRAKVAYLLSQGKSSGNEQSEALLNYSELNVVRMDRLEKTIDITPQVKEQLNQLPQNQIWLVLCEGWCGDVAQILPILHKMAEATNKVNLKILFRDENDAVMNLFLTNGSRSIPKLIVLDAESLDVITDWGPRPKGAKQLIVDYKAQHGVVDEPAKIALQKWYLNDKGVSTQNEIMALL
jgi:thiol-disulfide isomerase/thioredoxin